MASMLEVGVLLPHHILAVKKGENMSVDAHLNILLIEDDWAIAKVIALELEHQGHQVKLAQDGRVELDMALKNEWDVILLDIMLPF